MSRRNERVSPRLLRGWGLPSPGGSKYDRGTVLVVGGSLRSPGAAMLAGTAALRVGAGKITLGVARSVAAGVAVAVPESGVVPLPDDAAGSVRGDATAALLPELEKKSAVLIGSGLDDIDATREIVSGLVAGAPEALVFVLDAYALAAVADQPELVRPLRDRLILTPNPVELATLLGDGEEIAPDDARRIRRAAQEIARRFGAAVATQALVAAPDGATWTLKAGGPGLGTSGSGDVLAGAVTGFAARGISPAHAAVWGTYVHAAAGDQLAHGEDGVGYLAGELPARFPRIIADLA
ncbi:NAD(P)H-hydrate dehydratase [Microbacterium oryzae]|uniref:NAD(P)H-hydrate dehydratase n=1 Tax=Microbacterium oryzae TaxID=743009 RepID=UPI0025B24045|nr:NAD(P)H-hydrate dehydratase [Microbacterium oryzae]MDN3312075.1 NAD(P)H-hydrate dehydratase [Microbacterium oryzae]